MSKKPEYTIKGEWRVIDPITGVVLEKTETGTKTFVFQEPVALDLPARVFTFPDDVSLDLEPIENASAVFPEEEGERYLVKPFTTLKGLEGELILLVPHDGFLHWDKATSAWQIMDSKWAGYRLRFLEDSIELSFLREWRSGTAGGDDE